MVAQPIFSEALVVVGVDGSAASLDAVRYAAAEAHRRCARLRLVHASPDCPESEARRVLDDAVASLGSAADGLQVERFAIRDDHVRGLLEAAAGADLLVLNAPG